MGMIYCLAALQESSTTATRAPNDARTSMTSVLPEAAHCCQHSSSSPSQHSQPCSIAPAHCTVCIYTSVAALIRLAMGCLQKEPRWQLANPQAAPRLLRTHA